MTTDKEHLIRIFPELSTNGKLREEFYQELENRIDLTTVLTESEPQPRFIINRTQTRSLDALEEHIRETVPEDRMNQFDLFLFNQNERPVPIPEKSSHMFKGTYKILWQHQTSKCTDNKPTFDKLATTLIKDYGYKV